jgi:chaperonin cofactor prefoldin
MANLGTQAAAEIDTQISKFRALQEELGQYNANFGTLMAQRNENEMVLKELEVCQAEDGEGGECVVYKQVRWVWHLKLCPDLANKLLSS